MMGKNALFQIGLVVLNLSGYFLVCVSEAKTATFSNQLSQELILTTSERTALNRLKTSVKGNLTQEFMRQDLYLLRWVRAYDLDVGRTTEKMFHCLEFYRESRIKNIVKEDWKDFMEEFPFHSDITDRLGRPVAYGNIGSDWDMRRGILQGKGQKLIRYTYKIVFELNARLIEIARREPNVTQFVVVINLEGYNLIQHACPMCIATYIALVHTYERCLPGFAYEIIVINAPETYLHIVDLIRRSVSKQTGKALRIFGERREVWKAHLDSLIEPGKLPGDFGGTAMDRY